MAFAWAALGIAAIHVLSPGHWLPYVAAAKANGWPYARLLGVALAGMAVHLGSTFVLMALALLLSTGLSHLASHIGNWIGGALLVALAAVYLLLPAGTQRCRGGLTWLLAVGVGIQPCAELVPVMLAAAADGSRAVLITGAAWGGMTLLAGAALVSAGFLGLRWVWTDRHVRLARIITGLIFLATGLLTLAHGH